MSIIEDLKGYLDEKVNEYNSPDFITHDPIAIPHQFSSKEDIEISAFLVSTIAWGNRKMILKSGYKMMELLDNSPHDFIVNHTEKELKSAGKFVHRTFNGIDFNYFIKSLSHLYKNGKSLEDLFEIQQNDLNMKNAIHFFKKHFFALEHPKRTEKHVGDPLKSSAAKKINMFLRWMVRDDNCGVDFGIWKSIPTNLLSCPLDVHSGTIARKLGLLNRNVNDWKAVELLDESLRKLDPIDPVKYDFALFGLGVNNDLELSI